MTRRVAITTGLYALVGGIVSLAGWVVDLRRFTDWANTGISIQPNAALCVLLCGASVLSLAADRRWIALFCGAFASLIGGLHLLQWVTGTSFGIDELLMFGREWGRVGVVTPGRMGPPGSLSWTLLGFALVSSVGPPRLRALAPKLAVMTGAVSGLSLIGYLYGVDKLYALPHFTVIALQTSTFILAVSIGVLASHPEREPMRTLLDPGSGGLVARRALPLMLIVPIVVGFLRVKGQDAGLFDTGLGSALVALITIGCLTALVWWAANAVRVREQALHVARRAAEADARALDERQYRIEGLLGSIGDAFVSLDSQWRFTFVNDHAVARIGAAREELLARNLWEVLPDAVDTVAFGQLHRAMRERQPVAFEVYFPPWQRWFSCRGFPTPDGGLAVYALDITDRKRAEETLRDADRRKDEFLATLAHELRNPLAPVRNAVQLLRLTSPAGPDSLWALEVVDRQIHQMTRLIDDLLDASRIQRDLIRLRRERIALATAIQSAVETSHPLIEQNGHELTVILPPQAVFLDADLIRLAQVFSNLLNNAAKYTDRGGSITLTAERQGSDVVVSIKDTGIGIPTEKLGSIFELFSQVEGALERSQGGLGIGLSLAKRLVEMHDGTIEVYSEGAGKGSEFVVRLPLVVDPQRAPTTPASGHQEFAASSFRILIVDDNRDTADSLGMILRSMGNEIRTAYDGEAAVRAAEEFRPQVALLDIGLPRLNGYEVCRRIRQQAWGRSIVLIAVTGWGQDEDKQKAEAAGFNQHMVKPVDPRNLLELLGSLSARRPSPTTAPPV